MPIFCRTKLRLGQLRKGYSKVILDAYENTLLGEHARKKLSIASRINGKNAGEVQCLRELRGLRSSLSPPGSLSESNGCLARIPTSKRVNKRRGRSASGRLKVLLRALWEVNKACVSSGFCLLAGALPLQAIKERNRRGRPLRGRLLFIPTDFETCHSG